MKRFNLALRLLWRDGRSGELTILVLALLIAVTSSTAIALFSDRLQNTMTIQAAEFLAADLVITSPTEIPVAWQQQAAQLQLSQARTTEFSSVLMEHEEMLLASIKSVSSSYPLRGFLKTQATEDSAEIEQRQAPAIGTVWVEKRVLSALKLHIGDLLTIGEKPLTIAQIVTYEPDKRGDFYSFSPRVLMNEGDLAATGILQAGSHVHYFFQFSGAEQALNDFKNWSKPQLNPSQKLLDIHEDRPELGGALEKAERYLGLSSIIVILIAGVAIAMATRRYTERHFNATALLRCLGCKQREIVWLYTSQFVILGVLASSAGCLLGWFAQQGLFYLLRDLLPKQLAQPSISAVLFGLVLGLGVLLGFALPPLLRLKQVSPLRVLRRELEPLPASGWLVYGLAFTVITLLIGRYTHDFTMTFTIVGVGFGVLLVLGFLMNALLVFMAKLLPSLPLVWRFAIQGLVKNKRASISQLLAFSMTLVAMILSFSVRTDLITDWQKSMPTNAPNHFALNIFPEQQADFQQELTQQHISGSQFYPVVRGRLVTINNTPVQQVVSKDSQGDNATHRELSLTWTDALPEDNKITDGTWWTGAQAGQVSVEEKLAQSLKIKLGDELTFTIGSQQVKASVTSIRKLQWNTMKPNFYMIFSPNTLNNYPYTFITSFYLSSEQKPLLNALVKKYSSITVLEVDLILRQINTILTQLTEAINYLLYFALMAGFTVLWAAVYASLDNRIYEGALMRTLGTERQFLRTTHFLEFSILGLIAGLSAVFISEIIRYALYTQVMHIDYYLNVYLWEIVPISAALLVGLAGYWGLRDVVNKSPLLVLREL
jgi:putative ABC transport system permease protein